MTTSWYKQPTSSDGPVHLPDELKAADQMKESRRRGQEFWQKYDPDASALKAPLSSPFTPPLRFQPPTALHGLLEAAKTPPRGSRQDLVAHEGFDFHKENPFGDHSSSTHNPNTTHTALSEDGITLPRPTLPRALQNLPPPPSSLGNSPTNPGYRVPPPLANITAPAQKPGVGGASL